MTLAKKLILFICLVIGFLFTNMAVTSVGNSKIKQVQFYISNTVFPTMQTFREITEYVGEYRRLFTSFQRVVGTPDEAKLHVVEDMDKTAQKLESAFNHFATVVDPGEQKQLYESTLSYWKTYYQTAQAVIPLAQTGKKQEAAVKIAEIRIAGANFLKSMKAQVEYLNKQQKNAEEEMNSIRNQADRASMFTSLLAVIVTLLMGFELYRRSVTPLRTMSATIETIKAERNLALQLPVDGNDEVGRASKAFNELIGWIKVDLTDLRESVHTLRNASISLEQTAEQVSSTVASQSDISNSLAAATEELTTSIHQVADQARESRNESKRSGELAHSGFTIVTESGNDIRQASEAAHEAEQVMSSLQAGARAVEDVIGLISSLANQTNLLALNAAIEAARAGEMGRGFAVVADEVRKLAEDTKKATTRVTSSIENICSETEIAVSSVQHTVSCVINGVTRTEQANTVIGEIRTISESAVSNTIAIESALSEQTKASDSIARRIDELAQMASTNKTISEETKQAALKLGGIANHLNSMVDRYRLN